jgi:type VI secretion system secreted protein VgrG
MSDQDTRYEFISKAAPADEPLSVVSFTGTEGLSRLFEFEIELKSRSEELDIDALLSESCALKMTVGGISRRINGELLQFDMVGQSGDFVVYQARLVPRIHKLSQYRSNEVHVDETLPEIIEGVLEHCGLTSLDFDLRLEGKYRRWPLCCQFDETYLDFISRLMERTGLYYFFEHADELDRLVICDSIQGQDLMEAPEILFKAPTGLDVIHYPDSIHALICRQKRLPARVVFKDYNDENPSVNIQGQAEVDPDGIGEVYDYGSHVNSPDEARSLARITAEQLLSEKRRYYGESTVGRLQPGFLVSVKGHFRSSMNRPYQVVSIEHEGHAPSLQTGESTRSAGYRNSFTALESDVQFRAQRVTPKPRFYGTMNAFIDSETDGEYAQVDNTGRYKVVFPFDRVTRKEAKASCWIRMAQPYAGEGEGMHFPLRKNSEVLLTFIGGDPDRPVIAGAVPNHSKPSVITDQNQTKNVIQTSKGNRLEIEDRDDCKRIKLYSPHKNTYMHLGAPNHAGDGWVVLTEGMERKEILGGQQITMDAVEGGSDFDTVHRDGNNKSENVPPVSASVPNGAQGIAVTGISDSSDDNSLGTWKYRSLGGSWVTISGVSETRALMLDDGHEVRFEPNDWVNGNCTLNYYTWSYVDASSGDRLDIADSPLFEAGQNLTASLSDADIGLSNPEDGAQHVSPSGAVDFVITSSSAVDNAKWQYQVAGASAWQDLPAGVSTSSCLYLEAGTTLRLLPSSNSTTGDSGLVYATRVESLASIGRVNINDHSAFFSGSEETETLPLTFDAIEEHKLFTFRKQSNDRVPATSGGTAATEPLTKADELSGNYHISRTRGPSYNWQQGASFTYQTGPTLEVVYSDNGPATASAVPSIIKSYETLETELLSDLYGSSAGYKPTGALAYGRPNADPATDSDPPPPLTPKEWTDVIRDAHVSLLRYDTITGQKGNIYDFGGYWNYNLGNSYEENHIKQTRPPDTEESDEQTAVLNSNSGAYDILAKGGPEEGALKASVGGESLSDHCIGEVLGDTSKLKPGNLWTSKTYGGDSYDYRKGGKAIEINEDVSTLDINKGGIHVELSFNGDGKKTSWSRTGGGKSLEKKWHPKTGNKLLDSEKHVEDNGFSWNESTFNPWAGGKLETIEKGRNNVAGTDVYSASFMAKSSASLDFGASTSFSLAVNTSLSMSIETAVTTSINISGAATFDINLSASLSLKLSASAGLDLIGAVSAGPEIKFGVKPMEIDVRSPPAELDINSAQGTLAIRLAGAEIKSSRIRQVCFDDEGACAELKVAGFKLEA